MAFKLSAGPKSVWWPVDIQIPLDGGGVEVQKIDAQFEIIEQTEHDDIVMGKADRTDLLERVIKNVRQRKKNPKDDDQPILDENGAPLAFEDAKVLMLLTPYIRVALYAGYGKAANGQGRIKN